MRGGLAAAVVVNAIPGVGRAGLYGGRSRRRGTFDPRINRHTGLPHEHKAEIARRKRQARS